MLRVDEERRIEEARRVETRAREDGIRADASRRLEDEAARRMTEQRLIEEARRKGKRQGRREGWRGRRVLSLFMSSLMKPVMKSSLVPAMIACIALGRNLFSVALGSMFTISASVAHFVVERERADDLAYVVAHVEALGRVILLDPLLARDRHPLRELTHDTERDPRSAHNYDHSVMLE